jgi:DNA-binding CsgD family transcriptional regulator
MTANEQMLRQAMSRLLTDSAIYHKGRIRKKDGSVNISAWAREASLGATVPYRFKGLIAEFQHHLDRLDATPADHYEDRITRLESELAAEKDRSNRYRQERDAARQEAALLASQLALIDRENEILRAERPGTIRPLNPAHRSAREAR